MPVQVNPLILQDLFYEMLDDLEHVHNTLYNSELEKHTNMHYRNKRLEYQKRLDDLLK